MPKELLYASRVIFDVSFQCLNDDGEVETLSETVSLSNLARTHGATWEQVDECVRDMVDEPDLRGEVLTALESKGYTEEYKPVILTVEVKEIFTERDYPE